MADMKAIADALISGNREEVVKLVQAAIDEKTPPGTILNDGLIKGMQLFVVPCTGNI